MNILTLAAALLLPLSAPIPEQHAYESQAAAETAAAAVLVGCSATYECGTAIYRGMDGYHFTAPVSQHWEYGVDYRVGIPASTKIVELLHTHPGADDLALHLSPSDKDLARRTGLPVVAFAVNARVFVRS